LLSEEVNAYDKHNQQLPQKAKKYILTQENFLKMIQLTFSPEVAQAYQAQAQVNQAEAKNLKINLTLENIEKFFIEVKEEAEEKKVEISISVESKSKN
jgi:hypothetical protein